MKLRSAVTAIIAILLLSPFCFAKKDPAFNKKFIRERMLKVARWQLRNPKHEPYDWTNGAFYAGISAAYESTGSAELLKALNELGTKTGWKPGRRFDHADDIAIAQTYLDLYRLSKDPKIIAPTIETVRRLSAEKGPEAAKHGITWWWCDALFMAPPTLAKLASATGDKSYLALNDRLFKETYDLLYDRDQRLFARDASYLVGADGKGKREANGTKIFWSRGNGWVLAGLARLLSELPKDHPTYVFYRDLFKEMAARIIELQQSDGLWRSSLLDPEAYPGGEASGSGFYTYALAWGVNHKILDKKKFEPAVRKAWIGLNTLVHDDGMVGWTQPIGADPRKNFGPDSWEVFGAGAYLLAGSEVGKL
ncbi:MAG TPA: glycoside hydrolase family 88 protein [Pyrinomonadaceae bacterium]|nr:glycoside hydrolase family 88 protein [Pyrinomonadaceae bacterium]HNU07052.1 glycoside hydrolase family 88 protein [Pyrinomonadaceae bacterium]